MKLPNLNMKKYWTVLKIVSFFIVITILGCDSGCPNTIYMMITFRNILLDKFSTNVPVSLPKECAELCRESGNCKSFGVSVDPMTCYLYDGRIYAGSPELNTTEIYYYWELEDKCPFNLGYTLSSDKDSVVCTKHYDSRLNWTKSQQQCEQDGGHLFIVNSDFRRSILDIYNTSVPLDLPTFIGGNDMIKETEWFYLNGDPVNKYFAPNKPINFNTQNCLTFDPSLNGLNDKNCSKPYSFICEVPLVP